ncbi:MAG: hypothetical protein ACLPY3_24620 [Solirubrobacteraceae bacterium]
MTAFVGSCALGWLRRAAGVWLIAVVRTSAGRLLGPNEGQEDKGGQKAEPPPREDPDVPGDR